MSAVQNECVFILGVHFYARELAAITDQRRDVGHKT